MSLRTQHSALSTLFVPLLPRHGLFVRPGRYGDGARFAAGFRAAWRRVPLGARRELLADWRRFGAGSLRPCPDIELSLVAAQGRGFARESFAATYFPDLRHFVFWVPAVDLLPDDLLQTLIAHELGHAWFVLAHGECADEEERVRALVAEEWGFDEAALTGWLASNRAAMLRNYRARLEKPR